MLGADGDPALTLEVVAVHDALVDVRVLAEHVGSAEDAVDQRRLTVIDVGDDGEIADLVDGVHGGSPDVQKPGWALTGRAVAL